MLIGGKQRHTARDCALNAYSNFEFIIIADTLTLAFESLLIRNLDKVLAGGSQFGANQQLFDLYQR